MPRRKRKAKGKQETQVAPQQLNLPVATDFSAEIDMLNRMMMQRFMPGYEALSRAVEVISESKTEASILGQQAVNENPSATSTLTTPAEARDEDMKEAMTSDVQEPDAGHSSAEEVALSADDHDSSEDTGTPSTHECADKICDAGDSGKTLQRAYESELPKESVPLTDTQPEQAQAVDVSSALKYRALLAPIAADIRALEELNQIAELQYQASWDKAWVLLDVLHETKQQLSRVQELSEHSVHDIHESIRAAYDNLTNLLGDIAADITLLHAAMPVYFAQQLSSHVGYALWTAVRKDACASLNDLPLQQSSVEDVSLDIGEIPLPEEAQRDAEPEFIFLDPQVPASGSDPSEGVQALARSEEDMITSSGSSLDSAMDDQREEPKADADIPAWSGRILPRFEMSPGMTLRTPAAPIPSTPVAAKEVHESFLIVSDEHRVDWRDLNYIPSPPVTPVRGGRTAVTVKAIAGGDELGGACYMVELGRYGRKILIDAGIRLRDMENRFPDISKLPDPDLIIITHAHLDHCGALPYIMRRWPSVPIWCHEETVPLIAQSLSLLVRQVGINQEHRVPELSLYDADEVASIQPMGRLCHVAYPLVGTDVNITFFPAGHCLGAVSFSIEGPEDSFFYSGEYAVHDEPSVPAADWPAKDFDVVVALCSGFADRRFDREAMQNRLVEEMASIVEAGAWAVFPVVETGRAQDIYLLLAKAMDEGTLPSVPIYWDGEQRTLATLYQHYVDKQEGESQSFLDAPAVVMTDELRAELSVGPGVLLTTSGILQEPVGVSLLTRLLSIPGSAVFRPARPDTPFDVNPLLSSIHPDVQKHYYIWPAHPTVAEMTEKVLSLSPLVVFMVHGDQEMQRGLRAQLPGHVIRRSLANGDSKRIGPRGF